ncbi:MAG: DUF4198 domain-containing protein [Bacteroidota bacterium]
MKKLLFAVTTCLLLCSHDMFLKLDAYFLPSDRSVTVALVNGTFTESENVITRDRMLDVSIVSNGQRNHPDTTQWTEKDNTTFLTFKTGAPGTYVVGVSTKARDFAMTADKFNAYLEHDGLLDVLADREATNTLNQDANERYAKHVKTIFQVGNQRSLDWKEKLGYPIEFVPVSNPYSLGVGDELTVRLYYHGEPLADQLVYVDNAKNLHTHDHGDDHEHATTDSTAAADTHHHHTARQFRTDSGGFFTLKIDEPGTWFMRTIKLIKTTEDGLTHQSDWATLTFGVASGHSHGDHSHSHAGGHSHDGHSHADGHDHGHDHGDGTHTHADGSVHHDHDHAHEEALALPAYAWWLGSALLFAGLFFYYNRQEA